MGNSQSEASSSSSSGEATVEPWQILRRTEIIPSSLFPTNFATHRRICYTLPHSASDFWAYAFTKECDSRASKIGEGQPIAATNEDNLKAALYEAEVNGQKQRITARRFDLTPLANDLVQPLYQYAGDTTYSGQGVGVKMHQAKGHAGYMEFALSFVPPWSKHMKAAGYALISDADDAQTNAFMYVTLAVEVDFHSDTHSSCLGLLWLSKKEREITDILYNFMEARFNQTTVLFDKADVQLVIDT